MIAKLPRISLAILMIGVLSCAAPRPLTRSLHELSADANRRGMKKFAQGLFDAAEADFRRALQLNRRIDNRRGTLDNLNNLAALHLKRGNPEGTLTLLQEGLAIAVNLRDQAAEIDLRIHIGAAEEMQEENAAALSSYSRAEASARALGDPRRLQAALGRKGQLELALQRWQDAKGDLQAALDLARSRGDEQGIAMRESDLGLLSMHQGHLAKAAAQLTSALQRHRKLEDPPGIALDLQRLGKLSHRQGDSAQAESYLKRAFLSHQADGDTIGAMQDLLILTEVYRSQGEKEKALKTLQEAEKFLAGIRRKSMIADYRKMEKELQKVFP